jgi:DNA-binding GntR family transcriptional regulator
MYTRHPVVVGPSSRASGAQSVYVELKRRIMSLELKPGERLFEPALAASLDVSRTPLREAIRRLTSENLLEQQLTGGVIVPPLSPREVTELYDVRAALEALMAREAARRATDADVATLTDILARNAAMVEFADDAMALGKRLHDAIAAIAANSWAERLHSQVADQMVRYRVVTNASQERRNAALEEHRALCDAIRLHDAERAGIVAFEHVLAARDQAVKTIEATLGSP